MKGKIIITLAILLLPFMTVKAYGSCSNVEYDILQQFANNITITYNPKTDDDGNQYFELVFVGVHNDLRIYLSSTRASYFTGNPDQLAEVTIPNLTPGKSYKFDIMGLPACYDFTFRTFTVSMPKFNVYSKDPLCEKARDFGLCQKWVKTDVDYNTFVGKVTEYINSKQKVEEQTIVEKKFSFYEFYQKYYVYCLVFLICVYILLEYLWYKKNKKERL